MVDAHPEVRFFFPLFFFTSPGLDWSMADIPGVEEVQGCL